MSDVDAIDRALRPAVEAADVLARSAAQVAGEVRGQDEPTTTIPAARSVVARLRGQAEDLLARLDSTDARLSELEEAALSARNFDTATWPARRDALAAKLATDPAGGAADWLAAWARAFLLGCPAEADRLATEPFVLPPEALWCPDRLAVATDALTARSDQRLAPLLRYLAEGAPLGGRAAVPGDLVIRAQILRARLLIQADRPQAATELLGLAGQAGGQQEAEVLAARAVLARLWPPGAHTPVAGPDSTALAQAAWKAERCPAAAVEMFHADSGATGTRSALDTARALIDELPAVADPHGALEVLVLPVPDEIWLAAADRAARERDFEAARRLADRVSSGAGPLLAAEAADLRARIAGEAGEDAAARADLLAAAGLANAIADRTQPAIEEYRQALDLVSEHQDATLGLADGLLVESWGKPLGEVTGQFHRALELLDASYARHPLESRTSWSLMTYSYLASALSNQAAAQARARELWRAPIAAARAIAFDPAQAQRWVRLAETLIELSCDQAAAVLSSHATKLAPDDLVVRRNRIATLTNLGEAGAALALLDQMSPDSSDGWSSAVRAVVLKVSARELSGEAEAERLDQARTAANEALRIEPQNLWYHLVRADVLLRAGKDDLAGEDFEYLWRESRLDQVDGLSFATRAAIELQLGTDATALSTQALDIATVTVGDYSDRFNHGAALALDGDPRGVPHLEAGAQAAATPFAIDYLRGRLDHLTDVLRRDGSTLDLTGVTRALDARSAEAEADTRTPQARVAAELDRVARNEHYPPEVSELAALAAGLTRAWCGLALGDPDALALLGSLAAGHPEYPELASAAQALSAAPLPGLAPSADGQAAPAGPVPGEQVLQAYLPASWFAELEDPLEHEIIKRFVPDARARLRRRTGAVLPGVNFRDDAGLEQMGFRILLHGSVVAEGRLKPRRWYCPAHLTAALSSHARARLKSAPEAAGPAAFPVLSSFPAPEDPDPLTVLVAWPPAEVVARRLELAYDTWQAAQPEAGPGEPARPPGPLA